MVQAYLKLFIMFIIGSALIAALFVAGFFVLMLVIAIVPFVYLWIKWKTRNYDKPVVNEDGVIDAEYVIIREDENGVEIEKHKITDKSVDKTDKKK